MRKSKKALMGGMILVFAILATLMIGMIILVLIGSDDSSVRESSQMSAHDLEAHLKWQYYLRLPSDDPRGLQLADAIDSGDDARIGTLVGDFVTRYIGSGREWKFKVEGATRKTGTSTTVSGLVSGASPMGERTHPVTVDAVIPGEERAYKVSVLVE